VAGIVCVSAFTRRVKISELVEAMIFGVLLRPHFLDVAGADHPIAWFFAELGRLPENDDPSIVKPIELTTAVA
jgi:hypothetical protein